MTFLIEGLAPQPYASYFGMSEAQLRERNAVRVEVDATPGYPCRITLEDAMPGETVILLNHVSREDDTPYRASHAIFVREGATEAACYRDEVPPVFAPRVLSLRAFDGQGMMIDARISQPGDARADLVAMFADPAVHEIDVHNATRGCFSAHARRDS